MRKRTYTNQYMSCTGRIDKGSKIKTSFKTHTHFKILNKMKQTNKNLRLSLEMCPLHL